MTPSGMCVDDRDSKILLSTNLISRPVLPPIPLSAFVTREPALLSAGPAEACNLESPLEALDWALATVELAVEDAASDVEDA